MTKTALAMDDDEPERPAPPAEIWGLSRMIRELQNDVQALQGALTLSPDVALADRSGNVVLAIWPSGQVYRNESEGQIYQTRLELIAAITKAGTADEMQTVLRNALKRIPT